MLKTLYFFRLLYCCVWAVTATPELPTKPDEWANNAPSFTLTDQDGKAFNIRDYIGKKVLVIYFYPKDESYGFVHKRSLLIPRQFQ